MPDGPGRFTRNSTCSALLRVPLESDKLACTGLSPSAERLSRRFQFVCHTRLSALLPRRRLNAAGLGSSAFARHYSRNHCCFLFLQVLRCFSSLRSPAALRHSTYSAGLPHSDTRGSKVICTSPRLFAAYRVLRRLPEPRHPPNALLLSFVSLQFLFLVFVFSMSMIVFLWRIRDSNP